MTVAELKQALSKYPDDMEVKISYGLTLLSTDSLKPVVDIDTNIMSLIMCGGRRLPVISRGK